MRRASRAGVLRRLVATLVASGPLGSGAASAVEIQAGACLSGGDLCEAGTDDRLVFGSTAAEYNGYSDPLIGSRMSFESDPTVVYIPAGEFDDVAIGCRLNPSALLDAYPYSVPGQGIWDGDRPGWIHFVGAGRDRTVLRSSRPDTPVAFNYGCPNVSFSNMTLEHDSHPTFEARVAWDAPYPSAGCEDGTSPADGCWIARAGITAARSVRGDLPTGGYLRDVRLVNSGPERAWWANVYHECHAPSQPVGEGTVWGSWGRVEYYVFNSRIEGGKPGGFEPLGGRDIANFGAAWSDWDDSLVPAPGPRCIQNWVVGSEIVSTGDSTSNDAARGVVSYNSNTNLVQSTVTAASANSFTPMWGDQSRAELVASGVSVVVPQGTSLQLGDSHRADFHNVSQAGDASAPRLLASRGSMHLWEQSDSPPAVVPGHRDFFGTPRGNAMFIETDCSRCGDCDGGGVYAQPMVYLDGTCSDDSGGPWFNLETGRCRMAPLVEESNGSCRLAQCADGVDNDADGLSDLDDPNCLVPTHDSESSSPQGGC